MDNNQFKFVVNEINKYFNKNFTVVSFDLLLPEQLLQILSDTLTLVDESERVDLQSEVLEETVVRLLEMLRILKYKLPSNTSPSLFRQGLVQGDKKIIHPILLWLVTNMMDLKKRMYLAQFLVKLDIPQEILSDPDMEFLFEQYEAQIEDFKGIHKEFEALKGTVSSVAELRSDITTMEAERESVLKKIERLKRKVEGVPDSDKLLEFAQTLRVEKERKREMVAQEEQQQSQAIANEQKLRRLRSQLSELKQNAGRVTAHDLLKKLEEVCSVNAYLAQQKLPLEIRSLQEDNNMMEMILNQPSLSRADIDDLNFKYQQVSAEVNQMIEAQMTTQNPSDDKNATFRRQVAIIAHRKEGKAEELSELRSQLSAVEDELSSKQKELADIAGDTVLRGDDFKKFVSKLRGRSALYKKQKSLLAALKSEAGVLTRTLEVLATRDQSVLQALVEQEARYGVAGYRDARSTLENVSEAKSDLDSVKGRTLETMSKLVLQLSAQIASKKAQLEPLITELNPLRQECRELSDQYEQMKRIYDSTAAGLENAMTKLQQEVDRLRNEIETAENEVIRLEAENAKGEADLEKVAAEMKLYVSGSAEAKKHSLREQLHQQISEQEKIGRSLKEEQNSLKELQAKSAVQVQYWSDLERLLRCKIECNEDDLKNAGIIRREKGAETLILQ